MVTRGEGGCGENEEGKAGELRSDRENWTLGDEHTKQYIDNILYSCTLETYNVITQCNPNKLN